MKPLLFIAKPLWSHIAKAAPRAACRLKLQRWRKALSATACAAAALLLGVAPLLRMDTRPAADAGTAPPVPGVAAPVRPETWFFAPWQNRPIDPDDAVIRWDEQDRWPLERLLFIFTFTSTQEDDVCPGLGIFDFWQDHWPEERLDVLDRRLRLRPLDWPHDEHLAACDDPEEPAAGEAPYHERVLAHLHASLRLPTEQEGLPDAGPPDARRHGILARPSDDAPSSAHRAWLAEGAAAMATTPSHGYGVQSMDPGILVPAPEGEAPATEELARLLEELRQAVEGDAAKPETRQAPQQP